MNKSRDNKSISFTVSDAVQMPVKKKSYKYMMLFKHKRRTPQLIERVKSEKEISKIHDIYRNCYERVINYDSRVANSMDFANCEAFDFNKDARSPIFSVKPLKLAEVLFQ